jgi:hypothetical protein
VSFGRSDTRAALRNFGSIRDHCEAGCTN